MLKKYILAATILLGGCSTISDIVNHPTFDNNEYAAVVNLRQLASHSEKCADATRAGYTFSVLEQADWLMYYTQYLPNNTDSYKMATIIQGEANTLVSHAATSSENYCVSKMKNMEQQIILIQQSLATKG